MPAVSGTQVLIVESRARAAAARSDANTLALGTHSNWHSTLQRFIASTLNLTAADEPAPHAPLHPIAAE